MFDWKVAAIKVKGMFIQDGDCLIWTGSVDRGYGSMSIHNKNYRVHRIVWQLFNGEIPEAATNVDVLHRCNNKLCSNPVHLYLGTPVENLYDAYRDNCFSDGRRSFTKDEEQIVISMFKAGNSLRKISRAVKSDHHKVSRCIERYRGKV